MCALASFVATAVRVEQFAIGLDEFGLAMCWGRAAQRGKTGARPVAAPGDVEL
jgi:hypothetical protein